MLPWRCRSLSLSSSLAAKRQLPYYIASTMDKHVRVIVSARKPFSSIYYFIASIKWLQVHFQRPRCLRYSKGWRQMSWRNIAAWYVKHMWWLCQKNAHIWLMYCIQTSYFVDIGWACKKISNRLWYTTWKSSSAPLMNYELCSVVGKNIGSMYGYLDLP